MVRKLFFTCLCTAVTLGWAHAQINCPLHLPLTLVGNTDYCIGSPGSVLSINETYAGYEWLPTTQTGQNAVLTAGNYQVVVTHYTGCTDTLLFQVDQVSNPPQPVIITSDVAQFCQGESVVLSVPINYPYYEWNTGSVSNEITVFESGTYVVSVTDWIGCSSSSNSVQVIVTPLPIAAFSPGVALFEGTFRNLSSNATSYEWNFGDGNTSTAFEPTHTYTTGGTMPMYLVAFNDCGSDTAFLDLESVGITEQPAFEKIRSFPNPSAGIFTIELNNGMRSPVEISIHNMLGQKVVGPILSSAEKIEVDAQQLKAGVYMLVARSKETVFSTHILITD